MEDGCEIRLHHGIQNSSVVFWMSPLPMIPAALTRYPHGRGCCGPQPRIVHGRTHHSDRPAGRKIQLRFPQGFFGEFQLIRRPPVMASLAPSLANSIAAAFPMPEEAP